MTEALLRWVDRQEWLLGRHQWSIVRDFGLLAAALTVSWAVITVPELLLDEIKNREIYRKELWGYLDACRQSDPCLKWLSESECLKLAPKPEEDISAPIASDEQAPWISKRMARYRNLVWCANACRSDTCDEVNENRDLVRWQFAVLIPDSRPWLTVARMHYRVNPGFFWDIGLFLPVSLAALCMGFQALLSHLRICQRATSEGVHPYIPRESCNHFLKILLHPWTLYICSSVAIAITAANHGYGPDEGEPGTKICRGFFLACLFVVVPIYIWIVVRGASSIFRRSKGEAVFENPFYWSPSANIVVPTEKVVRSLLM